MLSDIISRVGYDESLPLSGLQLWLKADEGITLDGNGRVSQWDDMSGIGRHVTQSVSGQRPLYIASVQNNKPGVQFVASRQDILESLTTTSIANCSVFTVLRVDNFDSTEDVYIAIAKGDDYGRCRFLYRNVTQKVNTEVWGGFVNPTTINFDYSSTVFSIYGFVQQSANVILFKDSSSVSGMYMVGGNQYPAAVQSTQQSYWGIGGSSQTGYGNYYTNSTICEVVIYNRDVTSNERTQITSYLKARWATP